MYHTYQNKISILLLKAIMFKYDKRAFLLVVWSLGRDLNPRPTTYKAAAPTELSYRGIWVSIGCRIVVVKFKLYLMDDVCFREASQWIYLMMEK